MVQSGVQGPPGLPGPPMNGNVTKGPSGLPGGKGEQGQQGPKGNGPVT